MADYYSRFYEVDILRNTTTPAIISTGCFLGTGPHITLLLITDHNSYASTTSYTPMPSTTKRHHPCGKRQNRSLLRAIRIAHSEGKDWKAELATFLRAYRTTPHSVTAVPPAEAFLQRKVRCKLTFTPAERLLDDARDIQNKGKEKEYGDQTARKDDIKVGVTTTTQKKQTFNYLLSDAF